MSTVTELAVDRNFKVSVYINTCLRGMNPATRLVAAKAAGKAISLEVAEQFSQPDKVDVSEILSLLDQAHVFANDIYRLQRACDTAEHQPQP